MIKRLRAKVVQGGTVHFDAEFIAEGLNMSAEQTVKWFGDGRASSRVMEINMARVLGMTPMLDDGEFDLLAPNGDRWEMKSITRRGARFAPSGMGGKRRKFNPVLFYRWLNTIAGYIFVDVTQFPRVAYWTVPIETAKFWIRRRKVSYKSTASRSQLRKVIDALPPFNTE